MDMRPPPSPSTTSSLPLYAGPSVRMIVLAGRNLGEKDTLAMQFGTSHKCLVPLAGRPLVAHVLQTAAVHPAIDSLVISVEADAFEDLFDVLSQLPGRGIAKLVEAHDTLVGSVRAAAEGWDGALLVTTADHPLLTHASIDAMIAALDRADALFAMASRSRILAAHPEHGHPFLTFADNAYASCNLYAARGSDALRAAEAFRGGGRFAGNAWAMLRAFGAVNLMRAAMRVDSLEEAAARLSRRFDTRIAAVVLDDGSQALDVDDQDSHAAAEALLSRIGAQQIRMAVS